MKITKSQLKQIIKEEVTVDTALLDAIGKLTKKIDDLDISIDFLSAAVIGGDTVSIGAAQGALGREYRPKIKVAEPKLNEIIKEELQVVLSEYKYGDMSCDELQAKIDDLSVDVAGPDAGIVENEVDVIENLMKIKGCAGEEEWEKRVAEEKENNPWAICTDSTGREDKKKYERCVKSVKKQNENHKTTTQQLKQIINEELHEGILDVFSGTSIKTILSIAGKIQKDIIFIKEAAKRLESYGEWEINRLLGFNYAQHDTFDNWKKYATLFQERLDTLISAGKGETEYLGGRDAKKLGWFAKFMGGDQKHVRDQIGKLQREVNEDYLRIREILQEVDDTAADEVKRLAHQAFLNSPIRNQWAAVDKRAAEKAEYERQKELGRGPRRKARSSEDWAGSYHEAISHDKLNQIIMEEVQSYLYEEKDHPGESCEKAHPGQEHEEWVVTIAEVSSEKQRRWACAQKDKPASKRAKSLSAAEAEEMCKSQVEEK